MFFIPLILTAGLDLSLPEFQPQTDLSGNVIVGSFDKEDSVDVLPLEDISINDLLTYDSSFDEKSVSDNETKKSIDISSNEKVKDSGGISAGSGTKSAPSAPDGYHYETLESTVLPNSNINGSYVLVPSSSGGSLRYIAMQPGNTYYITTNNSAGVFVGSSTEYNTQLGLISGSSLDYTNNLDRVVYAFVGSSKTLSATYLVSDTPPGDITGNDYTAVVEALGIINDNISEINDKLDDLSSAGADDSEVLDRHTQLFRAMLLCLLITFLYPIALSIVRNIVGGDSNV